MFKIQIIFGKFLWKSLVKINYFENILIIFAFINNK